MQRSTVVRFEPASERACHLLKLRASHERMLLLRRAGAARASHLRRSRCVCVRCHGIHEDVEKLAIRLRLVAHRKVRTSVKANLLLCAAVPEG